MNTISTLRSSILAGIAVGIAGFGYLALYDKGLGASLFGSVLFACALISIILYKIKLFTGTAGFIGKDEVGHLLTVLAGNILGCLIMALLSRLSPLNIQENATVLLSSRLAIGPLRAGALAIGCGFLMTTAVTFGRQGQMLPTLFCVPMFIVCGFPHCIADAFYYLAAPAPFLAAHFLEILILYICIVIGNFIGCNLYRVIINKE